MSADEKVQGASAGEPRSDSADAEPLTGRMVSVVESGVTVARWEAPTDYALGDWERAQDAERNRLRVKAWWAENEGIWYAEMEGADSLKYAGLAVGDTKEHALLDLLCLNAWHCDLLARETTEKLARIAQLESELAELRAKGAVLPQGASTNPNAEEML